jgi:NAD(P)-dependent dehydrogenase (short-subunit alcohol dehydrogenase family)
MSLSGSASFSSMESERMKIRFDNKVAVITGAGRGLGRAYALYLASRGAQVVVNDVGAAGDGTGHSASPAQAVADQIQAAGGRAVANYDSVAEVEGANNIVETALEHFGTVDILINNAGILRDKTFLKMSLADFECVLQVHLLGTVYVTKAAFPIMKDKAYGRIVLATSASGLFGNFGQTNYSAAKLGIVGFMNSLKLEGARYNIKVNTVAPLAASRLAVGAFREEIMPLLKQELVAAAVAYLCHESCGASGDIIVAGGGYYGKVVMVQNKGIRFDKGEEVTAEMIAQRYGEITNMDGAAPFNNSGESAEATLGHLAEP